MSADNTKRTHSGPDWTPRFLRELARRGNITDSCRAAKVGRRGVYDRRDRDPDFAAAMYEALEAAADGLEGEAWRRGKEGYDEPVIYQGELMGAWYNPDGTRAEPNAPGAVFVPLTVKRYSDMVLALLLKAHRPEKYRERLQLLGGGKDGEIVVKVLGRGASTEEL